MPPKKIIEPKGTNPKRMPYVMVNGYEKEVVDSLLLLLLQPIEQ